MGPVNALDIAFRKALERFYPSVQSFRLTDYKVRVLDGKSATASDVFACICRKNCFKRLRKNNV